MTQSEEPTGHRTAVQELIGIQAIRSIFELNDIMAFHLAKGMPSFTEWHFASVVESGPDPEHWQWVLQELLDAEASGTASAEDSGGKVLLAAAMLSLHLGVAALQEPDLETSLMLLAQANHNKGMAQLLSFRPSDKVVLARNGQMGGQASQIQNKEKRRRVEQWCAENLHRYKSVDGAARHVFVPFAISFRVAQKWIGEWKKKQVNVA